MSMAQWGMVIAIASVIVAWTNILSGGFNPAWTFTAIGLACLSVSLSTTALIRNRRRNREDPSSAGRR